MITKCNCAYHLKCLEANEVKLVYNVYHCILNTSFAHFKAYRHRGGFTAPLGPVQTGMERNGTQSFQKVER